MKSILLLTLLCLTTTLAGQIRQDTVFNRWGQITNIKHFSKINTEGVSKSYLFQRGLTFGDEAWQLDSICVFNSAGKFIQTRLTSELDPTPKKGPLSNRRPHIMPELKKEVSPSPQQIRITGYANSQVFTTLSVTVTSQEAVRIKIIDGPNNFKIMGSSRPVTKKRHEVTLSVVIPPGYRQQILRLAGPEGKINDIQLALRGHDLTESDFVSDKTASQLKSIDARERENLYLSLESTEKLLAIYQGDKVRYRIPVGRQVDIIPVYQLPPGDYRMEVIDLSTGEKRFYGLRR